ncbi:flagella biosynthesis chaperone FliJ [soil metagenome]
MSWAQSLIKLSAYEAEILQRRLADIAQRRDAVLTILQAMDMEAALESAHASGDAEAGWYLIGFREGLAARRAKANADLKALASEEQGCRDAMQDSFESKKKYEQVADADARARNKIAAAREVQAMDAAAARLATVRTAA